MASSDGLESARLLGVAFALLEAGRRSGDEAFLRRAVSTAYYAVFHCLARTCADRLVPARRSRIAAWTRVYRSLQHASVRKRCSDGPGLAPFPSGIRRFAGGLRTLQDLRHGADYDPNFVMSALEVRRQLLFAAELVRELEGAAADDQRDFATRVLLPGRQSGSGP